MLQVISKRVDGSNITTSDIPAGSSSAVNTETRSVLRSIEYQQTAGEYVLIMNCRETRQMRFARTRMPVQYANQYNDECTKPL